MRLRELLRQRTPELADQSVHLQRRRDEWVSSVEQLLNRMEGWLQRADPSRQFRRTQASFSRQEPGLGDYTVPGLLIECGPTEVHIVPRSRTVAAPVGVTFPNTAPDGLVHVTDGGRTFFLYRFARPEADHWWLVDHVDFIPRFQILDEHVFEELMIRFFAGRD